jgi:hypothetical protein
MEGGGPAFWLRLVRGGYGFRAAGETWIMGVNTPESAATAAKTLGGRVVGTGGC